MLLVQFYEPVSVGSESFELHLTGSDSAAFYLSLIFFGQFVVLGQGIGKKFK